MKLTTKKLKQMIREAMRDLPPYNPNEIDYEGLRAAQKEKERKGLIKYVLRIGPNPEDEQVVDKEGYLKKLKDLENEVGKYKIVHFSGDDFDREGGEVRGIDVYGTMNPDSEF